MAFLSTMLPLFEGFSVGDNAVQSTVWLRLLGVQVLLTGHLYVPIWHKGELVAGS